MMDMFGPGPKRGHAPVEIRRLKLPEVIASDDLTAPDRLGSPGAEDSDGRGLTDLLIQVLVERLPAPDTVWSLDERAKWLRTAASIFDLVYTDPERERRAIGIAVANQDPALTPGPRGPGPDTDLSA
jgi:hypothetical protein